MTSILLIIATGLLLSLVERRVRCRDEMKVLASANCRPNARAIRRNKSDARDIRQRYRGIDYIDRNVVRPTHRICARRQREYRAHDQRRHRRNDKVDHRA